MRASAVISFIVCLLISLPLPAAQPESRYTSIENRDCKFDPIGNEPGEADDQLKRCPGLGGARVLVNPFHARLRIGFTWSGRRKPGAWVVEAWSAGQKIEWRGNAMPKGFEPYAATVRMLYPKEGTAEAGQQVLAVIRIRHGEACLMGAVDIRANKNAYDLARNLADTAPAFTCAKDKPRILGVETEWAKNLVGSD